MCEINENAPNFEPASAMASQAPEIPFKNQKKNTGIV
jgi:hypothetical protein